MPGFLLCGIALGQATVAPRRAVPPPVPVEEVRPEDRGSIEGKVVDQTTGAPVRKANLTLRRNQTGPNDAGASYSAATDAGGAYTIADVDPGKYTLSIDKTGYVSTRYGGRASTAGTVISVDKKQKVKDIDFKLVAHGVIAGRVLDDEGDPVSNATVQALKWSYIRGKKQLGGSQGASTNDLGEYRLFGLAPGKYVLSATARGNMMMVESVRVRAEEAYALTYYPSALGVEGATPIETTPGSQLRGLDVRLRKVSSVGIKGRVVSPPEVKSLRNVTIMMMPKTESIGSVGMGRNFSRPSNAQGDFVMNRVTPGTYVVSAQIQENGQNFFGTTTVDVGTAPVEGVVLALGTGIEVHGTLKVEGSGPLKPADIRLNLIPKSVTTMMMGMGMQGGEVKEDGTFTFTRVTKDRFDVNAFASSGYLKSLKLDASDITDAGLDLSMADGRVELTVVYSTDDGQVEGTVQGDEADKTPKATVVAVPEGERRRIDRYYAMGTTDQTGHFTLRRLAPGEYRVFAFDAVEYGAYMDPDWLKPFESKGEKVTVKEGGKESLQLKLTKTE